MDSDAQLVAALLLDGARRALCADGCDRDTCGDELRRDLEDFARIITEQMLLEQLGHRGFG